MRGWDLKSEALFSYVNCEARVPKDRLMRPIQRIVDEALRALSTKFEHLHAKLGRPSIPHVRLLRVLFCRPSIRVRSELQLMEQLDCNLLFRWWDVDGVQQESRAPDRGWHRQKVHGRGPESRVGQGAVVGRRLPSRRNADRGVGPKSFRPRGRSGEPPAPGRNDERELHREMRSNQTRSSITDPDARLYRKGPGQPAKLAYPGHVLMENRHALTVDTHLTLATGTAERVPNAGDGSTSVPTTPTMWPGLPSICASTT